MKYFSILFLAFLTLSLQAQVDRSKAPEPGPDRKFEMGEYVSFTLDNGLQAILVENHKIPRISYQLVIDRPPLLEGDKAGYVSMAGDLLSSGTTNRTKEELDEEIDFLGARFFTSSSMLFMSGLSRNKDKMFEILADVTLNPSFPEDELERLRKQQLSSLAASKEDPNSIISRVSSSAMFGLDHPYGETITEATLNNIELADCKGYYKEYFSPKNAYLVIVGDINKGEAQKLVGQYLGKWKGDKLEEKTIEFPELPDQTQVALSHKSGAVQSVIRVTWPLINKPGNPDAIKLTVTNAILGGSSFGARLMQNLREDKAYTYGARSSLGTNQYIATFSASASVRNEVTDSAITEFLYEINKMQRELVDESELNRVKSAIKGSFARGLERPQTMANYALNIALYDLPKDYYETYLQKVEAITIEDVKATAEKYFHPNQAHIVVVGNMVEVGSSLEQFGPTTYYDAFGRETKAPSVELPEGLTAKQVLLNHIEAKGGMEAIRDVKSFEIVMSAVTPQGEIELIQKADLKKMNYLQIVKAGGNVMSSTKMFKGKKGFQTNMTGKKDLTEEDLKNLKDQIHLCEEIHFLDSGSKLSLEGGEVVNGEQVAVVKVTLKDDREIYRYYRLSDWYLVSQKVHMNEQDIITTFSDHERFDGILLPGKTKSSVMPIEFAIKEVNLNEKFKSSIFK